MTDRLKALADAGVSIWLDDLSRERIETCNLASLVKDSHVVGVTTNPTIFQGAISNGEPVALLSVSSTIWVCTPAMPSTFRRC